MKCFAWFWSAAKTNDIIMIGNCEQQKKGSEPCAQAIKLSQKPNIIHIRLKGVI